MAFALGCLQNPLVELFITSFGELTDHNFLRHSLWHVINFIVYFSPSEFDLNLKITNFKAIVKLCIYEPLCLFGSIIFSSWLSGV